MTPGDNTTKKDSPPALHGKGSHVARRHDLEDDADELAELICNGIKSIAETFECLKLDNMICAQIEEILTSTKEKMVMTEIENTRVQMLANIRISLFGTTTPLTSGGLQSPFK